MKAWPTSQLLILALGSMTACNHYSPSSPTPESAAAPIVFVETDREPEQEPGDESAIPPITPGECPAVVADVPSPFFGDRVLIRLPGGMEDDDLTAVAFGCVELAAIKTLTTCVPGRNATIESMTIELRVDEPNEDIEHSVFAALRDRRMLRATLLEADVQRDKRAGDWVYQLDGNKLLVTIRSSRGQLVVGMVQVPAADWPLVLDSLRASAARTHFLSP